MKLHYFIDIEAIPIKALYPLTFSNFMARFSNMYTVRLILIDKPKNIEL
jgi:hypothetical protein